MQDPQHIPAAEPTAEKHVDPGIPTTRNERDALRRRVREFVRGRKLAAPMSLPELLDATDQCLEGYTGTEGVEKFTAVLIGNELWEQTLAGIDFSRRLLLMPQCLRDANACEGSVDEFGLKCAECGRCALHDVLAEARELGYVTLVAEGSAVVMSLLASGKVEAVIGVGCMDMLEKVFPYMHSGAIPGLAIPLLRAGCEETDLDLDWLTQALRMHRDAPARRLNLPALRENVRRWFTPPALEELLGPADDPASVIAREWLLAGGKRWRPLLAVCAHQALAADKPVEELKPLAVALECFHKASLIHDDIEDGDDTRYGAPCLHVRHGVGIALNAGDLLIGEGYRLLGTLRLRNGDPRRPIQIAAEAHRELCIGQGVELQWMRDRRPMGVDEVMRIAERKTAPAFRAALQMGLWAAGSDDRYDDILRDYSRAIGAAYQLRDDLHDIEHSAHPAAGPSAVLAVAWESASRAHRDEIERVWRGNTLSDRQKANLRKLLTSRDVQQRCRDLMEQHKRRAEQCLRDLKQTELKALLQRIIGKMFYDVEMLTCCHDDGEYEPTDD